MFYESRAVTAPDQGVESIWLVQEWSLGPAHLSRQTRCSHRLLTLQPAHHVRGLHQRHTNTDQAFLRYGSAVAQRVSTSTNTARHLFYKRLRHTLLESLR